MHVFLKLLSVLAVLVSPIAGAAGGGDLASPVPQMPGVEQATPERPDAPKMLAALAVKYEHAEGVPRDYSKAIELYCQAARLGSADAQYALGWMYANGRGVGKDDNVAAQFFFMAAEQGHVQAQNMVRHARVSSAAELPACLQPEKEVEVAKNSEKSREHEVESQARHEAKNVEESAVPSQTVTQKSDIFKLVHQLAPAYEVDPKLALAVISIESGFNVRARSPKNAQGLMQLIPETAHRFSVENPFDARENIKGGLAYLQWLLAFFKGSVPLVVAAYNAGEKAVEKYRGIPPYPETQNYVKKIARLYKKTTHPYNRDLVDATSASPLRGSLN